MYLTVHVDISLSKLKRLTITMYITFSTKSKAKMLQCNYMRYGRDDEVKITVHKIASVKL